MKVSKVVLVVVALHVLVIGGIFIFEGCSRSKAPGPQLAENETQPNQPAPAPAPAPVAENNLTAASPVPAPVPPPAPAAPVATPTETYVVKKGDSLYKIAKTQKVTMEQLAKANNLSLTSKLQVGQKLIIPTPIAKTETAAAATTSVSAPVASATTAAGNTYEVKAGDSLWKIAKNHGVTVSALKQANNLTKDMLHVGQKLVIPAKTQAATAPVANTMLTTVPNLPIHIVVANDTWSSIAQKYGVKVEELLRFNNRTLQSPLRVGDKLVIPQAPAAPANASPAVIAPNLIAN